MSKELRTSAGNLDLMIASYVAKAEAAIRQGREVEADAWNDAALRLMDARDALDQGADRIDGTWHYRGEHPALPVYIDFPMGIEHA